MKNTKIVLLILCLTLDQIKLMLFLMLDLIYLPFLYKCIKKKAFFKTPGKLKDVLLLKYWITKMKE